MDGSSSSATRTTVVSAPGKVLIAGGYLVLEQAYPGLVIATTARFYSVVQSRAQKANGASSSSSSIRRSIRLHSPQFQGARWEYVASIEGERCMLQQTRETCEASQAGRNPFVALALLYSLRLALEARSAEEVLRELGEGGIDISVVADNDFYSQRAGAGAPSSSALRALAPFNKQQCAIKDVHKTGLGSSAAMTTSLVGSLLVHLGVVHVDEATGTLGDEELALIHNTAQLAHCAAQGKVGSGFDVSAAIWGSQLYRRFDKEAIQGLLDAGETVGVEGEPSSSSKEPPELSAYLDPRNPLWRPSPLSNVPRGQSNPTAVEGLASGQGMNDDEQTAPARPAPIELPPHVELVLADVDAGSNTPSMVGKIMAWRKSKPEWAQQMWTILSMGNQTLADGLLALRLAHAQDSQAYSAAIALASQHFGKDWDALAKTSPSSTLALLIEVRNAMRAIQGGMRELGRQADVPVQPDEMGNVIKATVDGAKGVIGGGVPGAGGYDALFVLFLDAGKPSDEKSDMNTREQIEGVWSHWKALSVGPLLSEAGGAAGVSSSAAQAQGALLQQGVPQGQPILPLPTTGKMEPGGLRIHRIEDVAGLHEAVSGAQV